MRPPAAGRRCMSGRPGRARGGPHARPLPEPSRIPSTTASTSLHTSAGRSGEISGHGQPVSMSRFPWIRASKPRRSRTRTSSSCASPGPGRPRRLAAPRGRRAGGVPAGRPSSRPGGAEQLRHRQEALVRDGPVLPEAEDGAGAARLGSRPRVALEKPSASRALTWARAVLGWTPAAFARSSREAGPLDASRRTSRARTGSATASTMGKPFPKKIVGNSPRRCVCGCGPPGNEGGRRAHIDESASDRWTWIALTRRLLGAGVGLETLDRPLDRPVVVPAEDRPQDRGEDAEQRPVGDDPPVEVDVDLAVRWVSVHTPLPVRSPTTLTSNLLGRLEPVISERVFRW